MLRHWIAPKREPLSSPDPRLKKYHQAVATARVGSDLYGHLTTRVEVWWQQTSGHLWWATWGSPVEAIEWVFAFSGEHIPSWTDGIIRPEDLDAEIDMLDRSLFELAGTTYQLQWLSGAEADQAWAEYGWEPSG